MAPLAVPRNSFAEDELVKEEFPIVGEEKKVSMVATPKAFSWLKKKIKKLTFCRNKQNGHLEISTGRPGAKSHGIGKNANDVFKAVVCMMFPSFKEAFKFLELEHRKNSVQRISEEERWANQGTYDFESIAFYTKKFNGALKSTSKEGNGVCLAGLQAQYGVNRKRLCLPLKCLASYRKQGSEPERLYTLEEVHEKRLIDIFAHHFSEAQMSKYRGSLCFVERNGHWFLEEMTDEQIKDAFRTRYSMPTDEEIVEQRKEFVRMYPEHKKRKAKSVREAYARKKKRKLEAEKNEKITKHFSGTN